jgi:heme exporter protein CcmD
MTQWSFVLAAYGVTVVALATLILWAYAAMRRAEAAADQLRQ